MASSKNSEYQKTSFLSKSNSAFIEQMYLKFINRESDLPESWKKYFLEIGEEFDLTRERIRQLEKLALCRLRHPSFGIREQDLV